MCVEYIPGFNNLILVAPHTFKNDGDDYEVHADEITEYLAQELGCHAYINRKISRANTDLNDLEQIKGKYPSFLNHLNQCVIEILGKLPDEKQKLYLITIHGYSIKNTGKIYKKLGNNPDKYPDIFIGWGKHPDKKEHEQHYSACPETVNSLVEMLRQKEFSNIKIDSIPRYCAWNSTNLVQLYRSADPKYRNGISEDLCKRIEAVQLEIKYQLRKGNFEDTAKDTAKRLEKALTGSLSLVSIPVSTIPFEKIDPDTPYNYRLHQYDNTAQELTKSIKEQDLLQTLLVQEQDGKRYRLICGHRRYEALRRLKKDRPGKIPIKILPKETSPEQLFKMSFEENTERRELNPLEMGKFLVAAKKELNLKSDEEVADRFSDFFAYKRSRQLINKYLNLHKYYKDNQSPEIIEAMCRSEKPLGYSLALSIAEKCENRGGIEARNFLFREIVDGLKASRSALNKILENMEQLCTLRKISTFQELLNLEEIKDALNSAKQANSQKASIFLRHLEKLTGQKKTKKDKDRSIECILSTVRDTQGVILKKTAAKRYRITIDVDFDNPEKLLDSLKDFVDGRRWRPFLQKNTQEENEISVG